MDRPPLIDPATRPLEPLLDYTALKELADEFLFQGMIGKHSTHAQRIRARILQHGDPLGETYTKIVAPGARRHYGATFTPPVIVRAMLSWAKSQQKQFVRVVDPGAGSGRFALAAARAFPSAEIIAVEKEPQIAHLLKATVIAAGLVDRIRVVVQDYRSLELPNVTGATLFVGNPPYVRHHAIEAKWKRWYTAALKTYDLSGSQLAGLHLHFLLKTRQLARSGDYGCFITAAEWLDVNYGSPLRTMFTNGMGGQALHLIDKTVPVFDDALTSAVILCFQVGAVENAIRVRHVASVSDLGDLRGGRRISHSRAQDSDKWSQLTLGNVHRKTATIELGDLFEVHRGQVTGMNAVWIAGEHAQQIPIQLRLPTVTAARELIKAPNNRLISSADLKSVVSLPADLNELDASALEGVQDFLSWAKGQGAHRSYIARHRRPWWRVAMSPPAPILMTYMARRPPTFVRNLCGARIVNIAHGLYPRVSLTDEDLDRVTDWLNANVRISSGRTYAGGLTKFEPREVMRLRIPPLELMRQR